MGSDVPQFAVRLLSNFADMFLERMGHRDIHLRKISSATEDLERSLSDLEGSMSNVNIIQINI